MATKRYLPTLLVYINEVSLVELQNVTINWDPKKIPVKTRKGLTGFTRGSPELTVSFKSAVPIEGPEFDPVVAAAEDQDYRLKFPYGRKTISTEGQFMDGSLDGSIDSNADLGFNFLGTFNKPK
jgi:hypothetical protein